jgi:hypothetical protein
MPASGVPDAHGFPALVSFWRLLDALDSHRVGSDHP